MSEKAMQPWEVPAPSPGALQPWETPPDKNAPPIDQTMHPNFGVGERLLLKNFANSPEAAVAYLKQKHPDMDIQNYQGQIIGKAPGETTYRPLDPNANLLDEPGKFFKDVPLDIGDVGTDLAQGAVSGAASAGAGVLGGLASLPAGGGGAIPAAMAGGAASNAGLEALKQKLGQYFGIPQEVSGSQVLAAGAGGAAAPLLFGSGGTGWLGKKAASFMSPGLNEVEQLALNKAQQGLVPKGIDLAKEKILPKLGEAVSGVPSEAIKAYAKNPQMVDQLKEDGLTDYVDSVHNNLRSSLAAAKNKIGRQLETEIDNAGAQVDLTKTKGIINDHIAALENSELKNNPLVKQQLEELKIARNNLLTEVKGEGENAVTTPLPDKVSAKKAFELQALLNDQAEISRLGQGTIPRFSSTMTPQEKAWAEANRKASQQINSELENATEGMSTKLKGDYREYAQLQRDLNSKFKTPETTNTTLSNLYGGNKQMLKERLERVGSLTGGKMKPMEAADTLSAYKHFAEPGWMPVSSGGTTSTSRNKLLGAGGAALGYKLGGAAGALQGAAAANLVGGPKAIQSYILGGRALQKVARPVLNALPSQTASGLPISIWDMIKNQNQEETP